MMIYLLFSIIVLGPFLLIITKRIITGVEKKEKIIDILIKNKLWLFVLMSGIIGLALARIGFYVNFGI